MPCPLLGAPQRQSIRQAVSLADLVTLTNGDVIELIVHLDSIARLFVALAQSERTNATCRIEAAIAESVDCRAQPKETQVELST